jgi:uncharacterized BrkB/YihY/UPF0761 family membrane protein
MSTGAFLFWSHALKCYQSNFFRLKLILLVLAGINIIVFHSTIDRRRVEWDKSPVPPLQARLAGFSSLLLWLASSVLFGRYLTEFPYSYVTYYAGLASAMIALVYLYLTASIFVYGGELNSAICRARDGARS